MRTLVDIPDEDIEWLGRCAVEQGTSRAALVHEAGRRCGPGNGTTGSRGAGYRKSRDDIGDPVEYSGAIRVIGSAASSGPGYSRASRPKAGLLEPFDVLGVDSGIAQMAADIRHSTCMNLLDALVLATARSNGAVLVTRNTRDFSAELPGIRVPYIL